MFALCHKRTSSIRLPGSAAVVIPRFIAAHCRDLTLQIFGTRTVGSAGGRHAPIDCLIARCKVALLIAGTGPRLVGRHAGPNPGDFFNASLLVLGNNDFISPRTDLGGWLTHKLTHI